MSRPPPPAGGSVGTYSGPLPNRWYRCHPAQYSAAAFNPSPSGNARFSPLRDGAGNVVPTLYLAASMKAALLEAALRDVPSPSGGYVVSKSDLWGRGLVVTEVAIMNARFADLTSMGLRRLGVKDVTTCDVADYPDTRAWATWFYESAPLVDGLVWMSRQLNTDLVCVLFGGRDVAVTPTGPPRRLSDPSVWSEIVDLLTQLDVSLVP